MPKDLAQTPLFNRVMVSIKNANSVLKFYAFLVKISQENLPHCLPFRALKKLTKNLSSQALFFWRFWSLLSV